MYVATTFLDSSVSWISMRLVLRGFCAIVTGFYELGHILVIQDLNIGEN
jgi:hypothetical protein